MASRADIASAFLRELGAPDNAAMRSAVLVWMSAESGNTIRANNPWNMTLKAASETGVKTCGSWTSTSSGLTFAAFCSPQDGAKASARLLLNAGHDWRKYDAVVAQARAGSPVGFLKALAASAWDAGRYGTKNGGANTLLVAYAKTGGKVSPSDLLPTLNSSNYPADSPLEGAGSPMAKLTIGGSQTGDTLGGFNNWISFPVGHIITAADVDYIMATLASHGVFANDPTGAAQSVTRAILDRQIGKPWNKAMQDTLQQDFYANAGNAIPKPLDALGSIAGAFTQILAALFDPRKWLLFLALLAGAGLTAYGGSNVLAAAR